MTDMQIPAVTKLQYLDLERIAMKKGVKLPEFNATTLEEHRDLEKRVMNVIEMTIQERTRLSTEQEHRKVKNDETKRLNAQRQQEAKEMRKEIEYLKLELELEQDESILEEESIEVTDESLQQELDQLLEDS